MGLFNNYNELEKQLLEHYIQLFSAMGLPDAKKTAKDMLDKAISESKERKSYYLPSNFGDIILENEKAENPTVEKLAEFFRKTLPAKRAEGARDEDVRWWWNLNDIERRMMLKVDDFHRLALFINAIKNSKSPDKEKAGEEAGKMVWEAHPMYTEIDPSIKPEKAPPGLTKEDYCLPIELKDRINVYVEKRGKDDPEGFKKDIEASSTFNALVRKEIKAGKI